MTEADRRQWETRYASGNAPIRATVNRWLGAQGAILAAVADAATTPPHALDIACGAGGTLCWLAERGWQVTGVDISASALALAQAQLEAAGLLPRATLLCADLDIWRPRAAAYDLITCCYFLDRRLWPALRAAVRPNGLLCLQTYHTGRLTARPESNPAHLLAPGELAALVAGWGWRLLAARTDTTTEAVLGQRVG